MSKARETCRFCNKKFKNVNMHARFCKAQPPAPSIPTTIVGGQVETVAYAKALEQDQHRRSREIFLELVASVTRINQALATIVGEWRF